MRAGTGAGGQRTTRVWAVLATVLAMLAVLATQTIAGAANANRGEVVYGSDLDVGLTDSPDPVNSGNNLLLRAQIDNDGPADAYGVEVVLEHDEILTFEDATVEFDFGDELERRAQRRGEGEACFVGEAVDVVTCNIAFIGSGTTVFINFLMLVEPVEGPSTATSTVFATPIESFDPNDENNSDQEDTMVEPASDTSDSGFIPPEGGTLTTDPDAEPGATPEDPFNITMKVREGPGGPASVNEEMCEGDNTEFTLCIGNFLGNFVPPGEPGDYDRIVADLFYDHSIVAGGLRNNRKPWTVLYQKGPDDPVVVLERCVDNGNVTPCIKNFKRIGEVPTRDLRVRVIIDSDPRLATRK